MMRVSKEIYLVVVVVASTKYTYKWVYYIVRNSHKKKQNDRVNKQDKLPFSPFTRSACKSVVLRGKKKVSKTILSTE